MTESAAEKLRFGSLFAGIGGFDLGLERAGMECVWQVEIDGFCRRVLEKHWPHVKRYNDVREVGKHNLEPVDLICGGFPCQDISNAGKRAGIDGERSGLWSEFHRIICELRPRFVLVENVAALLNRGMGRVLGDLAACGFDAEWRVCTASEVGAPHQRERLFLIADRDGKRRRPGRYFDRLNEVQTGRQWDAAKGKTKWRHMERWIVEGVQNEFGETTTGMFRGMDDGIPSRLDRLHAIGNAVVPQVAQWIGERIVEQDQLRKRR